MTSQAELFSAETTWFHVFRDMINNGDLAQLDGSAIKVYLVVKSYTNFTSGQSFPSIELIAKKAGLSERQAIRCLAELESAGYISKEKAGRHNLYTLREKVSLKDSEGKPQAVATWDYIPNSVRDAIADLRNVMVTGDLGGAKVVTIQTLTINVVNVADNATAVIVNDVDISKLPKALQEKLVALQTKAKERQR